MDEVRQTALINSITGKVDGTQVSDWGMLAKPLSASSRLPPAGQRRKS